MSQRIDLVLPPEERFTTARAGAIATVNLELARALGRAGVGARVISPAVDGEPIGDVEVASLRFGSPRSLVARVVSRARRSLRRGSADAYAGYRAEVAREVRGDVVVVHNDPVLATSLAEHGHRVVLWLHNLFTGHDGAVVAALPAGVALVTVSDYVRRWTAAEHGLDVARIAVIHNGADAERFHPAAVPHGGDRLAVVCHGRIDPNKGQVLAAHAVALLRAEGLPVDLTIIGSPQTFGMPRDHVATYLEDLRCAADAAGARLTGRVPPAQIPDLLRTFDVALILPTVPDPFPLAGLEAMASGCAVVAVPLGGVDEMVGDAALRVEPTVDSVGGALRHLATEPTALRAYQELGRERALTFSWDAAAERLLALAAG